MSDEIKLERKNRRKVVARDINLQESELEKQQLEKKEVKQNYDNEDLIDQNVKLRKVSDEQDQNEELIKEDLQDSEAVWNKNNIQAKSNVNSTLDIDYNNRGKEMDFKIEGKEEESSQIKGRQGGGGGRFDDRGQGGRGGFRGGDRDRGGFRGGDRGGFNRRRDDDDDNDFKRGDLAGEGEDNKRGWGNSSFSKGERRNDNFRRGDRNGDNDFRRGDRNGDNDFRRGDRNTDNDFRRGDRNTDNDFKRGDLFDAGDDNDSRRPRGGFRGGDRDRDNNRPTRDRKDSGGWNRGENNNNDLDLNSFKKGQGTGGFKRSFVNKKWGEEDDKWDKGADKNREDDRDRERDRRENKRDEDRDEKVLVKEGELIKKDNNTEFRQVIKNENDKSTKVVKAPWSRF